MKTSKIKYKDRSPMEMDPGAPDDTRSKGCGSIKEFVSVLKQAGR